MSIAVFPDTTVFCNFAAVGRSDLLAEFLRDRRQSTETRDPFGEWHERDDAPD